ncbi:hypothetical protein I4U23_029487 [Adineta vaga]|nr:hypothetical protein I4U23_029487 [Adineta vaga]
MPKIIRSPRRDVENIRRKNVEDNQIFLESLLMTNIRADFLHSARSILRKHERDRTKKKLDFEQNKKEYTTRYNEKVKSGEIGPFVPEWQRELEEKKKEAEKRLLEKERKKLEFEQKRQEYKMRKEEELFEKELRKVEQQIAKEEKRKLSPWIIYYKNCPNGNPYGRVFKPRLRKVDQ